jgi:hypothetical protein
MARVLANNTYGTIPANDLAVLAHFLNRCSDFHIYTYLTDGAASPITFEIRLFHQAVILMTHQMSLNLGHEIHHDHNDD